MNTAHAFTGTWRIVEMEVDWIRLNKLEGTTKR